jgi:hypothetical protein
MGAYLDIRTSLERFANTFGKEHLSDTVAEDFPTVDLFEGMIFYKSDDDVLYRLDDLNPTWTVLDYDYFLFDFDAHAQEKSFPDSSFIGIKDISLATQGKNFIVSFAIGISILNDSRLQKHNRVIDKLFEKFYPTKRIPVFNISEGLGDQENNFLTAMDGAEILPVAKSNARVLQLIGGFLATGITAK